MQAITVLIVEDEELYADQLEMQLEQLGYTHLATVDNSDAALTLLEEETPTIVLMDVHIHGKHDGIELAALIREQFGIPIIFITSLHDDLTFQRANRIQPEAFLIKPFQAIQLQRTVTLVVNRLIESRDTAKTATAQIQVQDGRFFIKHRNQLERVLVSDIRYLQADGRYTEIHTVNKKYVLRCPLQQLVVQLGEAEFLMTHRSYVVQINHITAVDLEDSVVVLGEAQVPLSKRCREAVLSKLGSR